MKIVITGQTTGIGQQLYTHWKDSDHDVIGISRDTGYDIINDFDSVIEEIETADVFVNNANIDNSQIDLLNATLNKVPKTIVLGSGLHQYSEYGTFDYIEKKKELFTLCKTSIANPKNSTKILHVGLTFLPHTNIDQENYTSWKDMFSVFDHWISNPVFWDVNFNWKATELIVHKLKQMIPDLKDIS
jgi:hypothetical protein|tara:strand:+ start:6318 stop:6878 length:561 start_codon:yes stop_codon:yes gene_type:complete